MKLEHYLPTTVTVAAGSFAEFIFCFLQTWLFQHLDFLCEPEVWNPML